MTSHREWDSTCDALDHHDTAAAILGALPEWLSGDEKTADALAGQLGRAGFALVRIEKAPGFLGRTED